MKEKPSGQAKPPPLPSAQGLGLPMEWVGITLSSAVFFTNFFRLSKRFAFLLQTEGEEDETYDDPMNVVPKTPQS